MIGFVCMIRFSTLYGFKNKLIYLCGSIKTDSMSLSFSTGNILWVEAETSQVSDTTQTKPQKLELGRKKIDLNLLDQLDQFHKRDSIRQAEQKKIEWQQRRARIKYYREAQKPDPIPSISATGEYVLGDSTLVKTDSLQQVKKAKTIFIAEESSDPAIVLPERNFQARNSDWLTIILVVALGIVASVRYTFSKSFTALFESGISYNASNKMMRENMGSTFQGSFRLTVFSFLMISVFVYQLLNYYELEIGISGLLLFVACFGAVLGYFGLKTLIYRLVGILGRVRTETSEYLFGMAVYNKILGILLFPIVIANAYISSEVLKGAVIAGFIIVTAIYAMLLGRGFLIFIRKQFPIFYWILYLCTLEILPLFLILKLLVIVGN
ncbi:DUF4271 domain-containing protein [Puteibacter caeruleilacunae]|nr:DUF4271 domain-containing protein [Puteibacter caeruleilacunae]